jgi:cobalamin biosynthesis protein CbiG
MSGRIVVVGVSRPGAALAARIASALDAEVVAHTAEDPVGRVLPRLFRDASVTGVVVVLAVGATVRLLAPWLRGKDVDPAVVAVDDAGQYAVALLSGHRGGANALAQQVADAIGAQPVVTTASDSQGLLAVDLLGAEQGWRIEASPKALRQAAAAVVNGQRVGFYQDAGAPIELPPGITRLTSLNHTQDEFAAVLVVTDRCIGAAQLVYRPPSLVVGVGCSSGASAADVLETIESALQTGRLSRASLAMLATIDRRADEPGLRLAAEALEIPLKRYSAQALAEVEPLPNPSRVVQAAVGTPGVCEPAALLASGATSLLVPKVKTARATAAIARIPQPSGPSA